jgi:hypothetical protein
LEEDVAMRGTDHQQSEMFSYISDEQRANGGWSQLVATLLDRVVDQGGQLAPCRTSTLIPSGR